MAKRGASKQEKAARGKPAAVVAPEAWPAWNVERRRISTLTDHPSNVRTHPVAQLANLDASFAEHGAVRPLVVNAKGQILAGHGSRDSLLHLYGDIEIPVISTPAHWTEAQERAFMLRDNATALQSGWDKPRLSIELADLKQLGVANLSALGFTPANVNKLLAGAGRPDASGAGSNPEFVPEAPPAPVSRSGDVWLLGEHRIMCGDATNADHVAVLFGNSVPRACVTDPPYGANFERGKSRARPAREQQYETIANDDLAGDALAEFVCAALNAAFAQATGISAYLWSWHGETGYAIRAGMLRAEFGVQSQIVWRKDHFVVGRCDHQGQHEIAWYGFKGNAHPWFGGRDQGTVWDYPKSQSVDIEGHPTPKPVGLFEQCIGNITTRGDWVYDPFSGSGTTIIAAQAIERRALVMEINPAYVDVAVTRWEQFTKKSAVLAAGEIERAAVAAARRAEKAATPADAAA